MSSASVNTATANGGSCAITLAAASMPPAVREKASISMTSASSRSVDGELDLGVAHGRADDGHLVVVGRQHRPQALDDDVVVVGEHEAHGAVVMGCSCERDHGRHTESRTP